MEVNFEGIQWFNDLNHQLSYCPSIYQIGQKWKGEIEYGIYSSRWLCYLLLIWQLIKASTYQKSLSTSSFLPEKQKNLCSL